MPAAGPWPVPCAGRAVFSAADAADLKKFVTENRNIPRQHVHMIVRRISQIRFAI